MGDESGVQAIFYLLLILSDDDVKLARANDNPGKSFLSNLSSHIKANKSISSFTMKKKHH